ncbi:unnamed protein product [Darwinula stevensoni]|uniref:Large ribosomal subunit protein uL22m n=1 Tax=Darwinula stevensoni TaxID=69355 RepID=A0A7R8X272_9CRUS|nr:unnamed protein product [Darwinula stevensoni]CAG0883050.1 unnamed protein product [Darwinula stevensoni]
MNALLRRTLVDLIPCQGGLWSFGKLGPLYSLSAQFNQNECHPAAQIHTSPQICAWRPGSPLPKGPQRWTKKNQVIYPPQEPHEERRPAFVCHMRTNIKYSPWKMWYIASMVRGMSVDEAVKQLSFVNKKGAAYVRDTILEAQEIAVREHNVEYRSNLWVSDSFATKGVVIRGVRRHAKARMGKVEYFHCHYFVRLEEGPPPVHYFEPPLTSEQKLEVWLAEKRNRTVHWSL